MELPYKRREQEKKARSIKSTSNNSLGSLRNATLAVSSILSKLFVTFFASLAGAVIASFASIYFTLTTLESFKAEEALRQFAVSDLYRPLREKTSECLLLRSNALSALATYSGILKSINGYADKYMKDENLRTVNLSGIEGLAKPMLEHLAEYGTKAMEGQRAANTCRHATNNMAVETATVLGLNKEYEDLLEKQIRRRPKFVSLMHEDDILLSFITNPSQTIALGMAIKDGLEGDKIRMTSALGKLKSSLEKSIKQSESAYKYEEEMTSLAYKEDSEIARLFLSNLKHRFELTPKSTLSQTAMEVRQFFRLER